MTLRPAGSSLRPGGKSGPRRNNSKQTKVSSKITIPYHTCGRDFFQSVSCTNALLPASLHFADQIQQCKIVAAAEGVDSRIQAGSSLVVHR